MNAAMLRVAQATRKVLVLSLVAAGIPIYGATPGWREIRGRHLRLLSTVNADFLPVACEAERVADALSQTGAAVALAGHVSTAGTVIIPVSSERDLRELLPQFWERRGARPLGGYWSGPFGHHIAIRVDAPRAERLRRILHEYAHFTTHVTYGDAPPWFDEGMSELWTNATLNGDELEIGGRVDAHIKTLRSTADWIPLKALTTAVSLPPASERKALARFYAESWALTHYLVFERGQGRLAFEGIPGPDAIPSDKTLQDYLQRPQLATTRVPFGNAAECEGLVTREVPEVEALKFQAQALADGERPAAALPLLEKARKLAPSDPEVTETMGVVRFLGNQPADAAALFDEVIAAGKGSHLSYYYRAVLAEAVPELTGGAGRVPVLGYVRRALELQPAFAPANEKLRELEATPSSK